MRSNPANGARNRLFYDFLHIHLYFGGETTQLFRHTNADASVLDI